MGSNIVVYLAACAVICIAQPIEQVEQLPILHEPLLEVLFTIDDDTNEQLMVLQCVMAGDDDKDKIKYTWLKDGQPLDFKSYLGIVQQNGSSLVFKKATLEIEGQYQCHAETEFGIASTRGTSFKRAYFNAPKVTPTKHSPVEGKPFKLDCPVPDAYPKPAMVAQYLSQDMVAKTGDLTMIYCIYGGTPLAHPDWFIDGKNVSGNSPQDRITRYNRSAGRRLLIKYTIPSDQGTYSCEADNGVGKPQKHSLRLTVVSAPEYTKKPEPQMIIKEGQDVSIPCQVKGVNAPKVTWTYNTKPLVTNERLAVNNAGSSDGLSVADLTIKKVQKNDKGYYGCKAVNDHGDVYSETLLYVA